MFVFLIDGVKVFGPNCTDSNVIQIFNLLIM